jgi:hypothetical protein
VTNVSKKRGKRARACPKASDAIPCISACSTQDAPPAAPRDGASIQERNQTFLDDGIALLPQVEAGLDALRASSIAAMERPPSRTVHIMAEGATALGLTDLACFAMAFESALARGENGPPDSGMMELFDKAFSMLSLHLEATKAGAAWNGEWDRELLSELMVAASRPDLAEEPMFSDQTESSAASAVPPLRQVQTKPQAAQVQWHKHSESLWDGRESLFLKLWGLLSRTKTSLSTVQWSKPASPAIPAKEGKQPASEDDPFAEALR